MTGLSSCDPPWRARVRSSGGTEVGLILRLSAETLLSKSSTGDGTLRDCDADDSAFTERKIRVLFAIRLLHAWIAFDSYQHAPAIPAQ